MRIIIQIIFSLVVVASFSGCSTIQYLLQATKGQLELSNRSRPIEDVLKDERVSPRIQNLLKEIPAIKEFGEKYGIRPTHNYEDYVKLDRSSAVWVVSACEKLNFKEKRWSFPVVGGFNYLGWFSKENAVEHGEELKKEGWDVYVRGASAFSTLGWFKDPVLSTMISSGVRAFGDLVNVIIHESIHATVYVSGQSYFNESMASFVADRLTVDYLKMKFPGGSEELNAYRDREKRSLERSQLFHRAYKNLNSVYRSDDSDELKREKKTALLTELQEKLKWKRALNNATLIQFKTYGVGKKEFQALYRACDQNWNRFLGILGEVSEDAFRKKHQKKFYSVLKPLVEKKCQLN